MLHRLRRHKYGIIFLDSVIFIVDLLWISLACYPLYESWKGKMNSSNAPRNTNRNKQALRTSNENSIQLPSKTQHTLAIRLRWKMKNATIRLDMSRLSNIGVIADSKFLITDHAPSPYQAAFLHHPSQVSHNRLGRKFTKAVSWRIIFYFPNGTRLPSVDSETLNCNNPTLFLEPPINEIQSRRSELPELTPPRPWRSFSMFHHLLARFYAQKCNPCAHTAECFAPDCFC